MKKVFVLCIGVLLFASCELESISSEEVETTTKTNLRSNKEGKVNVCHKGKIINVSVHALSGHQRHGDAVDMDDDGYFDIDNSCSETDCDDNSYASDNICAQIGDLIEGGIVFYLAPTPTDLDGDGILDTGLVAAPSNQNPTIQWYNGSYIDTGAIETALGTGQANTNTIILAQGAGSYAAKYCDDLTIGIYNDWFLPSKDELNWMYENIGQGNALGLGNLGGFEDFFYSSSSEINADAAWVQRFDTGVQFSSGINKHFENYIRAVRAF